MSGMSCAPRPTSPAPALLETAVRLVTSVLFTKAASRVSEDGFNGYIVQLLSSLGLHLEHRQAQILSTVLNGQDHADATELRLTPTKQHIARFDALDCLIGRRPYFRLWSSYRRAVTSAAQHETCSEDKRRESRFLNPYAQHGDSQR